MASSRLNDEMEQLLSDAFSQPVERHFSCRDFSFDEVDFPASSESATIAIGIESILSPMSSIGCDKVVIDAKVLNTVSAQPLCIHFISLLSLIRF